MLQSIILYSAKMSLERWERRVSFSSEAFPKERALSPVIEEVMHLSFIQDRYGISIGIHCGEPTVKLL